MSQKSGWYEMHYFSKALNISAFCGQKESEECGLVEVAVKKRGYETKGVTQNEHFESIHFYVVRGSIATE